MMFTRYLKKARLHWLFFTVLGCLAFVIWPRECLASAKYSQSKYDAKIKAAWRRNLPEYHWGLGWAQLWQESRLNPNATSPVGAAGVGQFMPGTWRDMQKRNIVPDGVSVRNVHYNIHASASYMRIQLNGWQRQGRTQGDLYDLGLAGYNAGRGHLYKSQRLCDGAMSYSGIIACLPDVTGEHSKETIDYVEKIHHWYTQRFKRRLWW